MLCLQKSVKILSWLLLVDKLSVIARSGAPWVRKFGKLSIRESLVMTSPYVSPYVRTNAPGSGKKSAQTLAVGESKDLFICFITVQYKGILCMGKGTKY